MRSMRMAAVTLALAAGAGCSDDDADDATTVPATEGSAAPATTSAPSVTPATVAATEAPLPTLDDTEAVGGSRLYSVDLTTGAATALGRIGAAEEEVGVLGLAFAPDGGSSSVYGLTDAPALITFDPTAPETLLTAVPITGVASGSTLLAIDVDPADGRLLAISDAGVLYAIDPATGAATAIGDGLGAPLADPGVAFDAGSTGIRIDVATGEQLLVDPGTGALAGEPAATVTFGSDDVNAAATPRVVAIAQSGERMYGVDVATGSLVVQDPAGVLTTVGALGVDLTDGASFDIATTGEALLASPG